MKKSTKNAALWMLMHDAGLDDAEQARFMVLLEGMTDDDAEFVVASVEKMKEHAGDKGYESGLDSASYSNEY